MRTLIIMRHAKSDWNEEGGSDFDRTLNKRGKHDAKMMGGWLRDHDFVPSIVVTSSAKRARSTAKRVAKACDYGVENIRHTERLYLAPPSDYLQEIADIGCEEADDDGAGIVDCACVLMVGHNPGVQLLVSDLTGEMVSMPTAGVAVVQFDEIDSWEAWDSLAQPAGRLVEMCIPRQIDSSSD